jgi:hypothetical protein
VNQNKLYARTRNIVKENLEKCIKNNGRREIDMGVCYDVV